MEKRVVVDQITIDVRSGGHTLLRFCKQIVDDDGTVLSEQYHRTSVAPGGDVAAQLELVDDHLTHRMKVGSIVPDDKQMAIDIDEAIKPLLEDKRVEWEAKQAAREAERAPAEEAIESN